MARCLALLLAWPALADCPLRLVADVPLRDTAGFLTVPAEIGGRAVSMLVDTGSEAGLLSPTAARGLAAGPLRVSVRGTGGAGRDLAVVRVPSMVIGGLELTDVRLPLGTLPASPGITPPVEGLIGGDVLSQFEVEMDVPAGRMRLYRAKGLSSLCRDLPPWENVPLTRVGHRIELAVTLNGRPVTALLDSGARSRIVSDRAAASVGVDRAELETEPGGVTSGIDGRDVVYHWHQFESLAIGNEVERGPVLTVMPLAEQASMLIGADWFARHRVWVSYGTSQMFVETDQRKAATEKKMLRPAWTQ